MAQTVNANMLTLSHKGTIGFEINTVPDVCKTPSPGGPIPVPYVIISKSSDLANGTKKTFADGGNSIANRPSYHSRCTGDEPGTLKGVISNTNIDKSHWITFSPTVYAEGKNVCRLTDKMFMNNRNCISGTGGHFEIPHPPGSIMFQLCQIFCEAREEWHKCKASGKAKCEKPSKTAERKVKKQLSNPKSKLNDAVKKGGKGRVGGAEKQFFVSDKKGKFKGLRKTYDEKSLKRALKRQLKKEVRQGLTKKGAKMLLGGWKKLIPGLNVASTVYDIVDTGLMVREIYKSLNAASVMKDAIKIRPDFSIQNADGSLHEIYDFKFDDPKTGYKDGWQSNGQEKAYKDATGKKPTALTNDAKSCNCDGKSKPPTSIPTG
ncbi:PAAR-like domain-containing protein [Tateyamaria sp. SN6-1]|uniref:PAAR-like domain-containing protein n=1 Tax=Tateyamaria sp. SN6-1 TaxID=3092148 RepID=UPI0039F5096F